MARALNLPGFLILACLPAMALAQALPDPTRPPGSMASEAMQGGGEYLGATGPVLQSVILPRTGRPRALISGEWVELGRKYGDARVVKITADRVEMAGPQGRDVIRLTPAVEKRASTVRRGAKETQGMQK